MQYGSTQNKMYGQSNLVGEDTHQWNIGDGVTALYWSDRHAYTVISVSDDDKTISIQRDFVTSTPGSMGASVDSYQHNPDGEIIVCKYGSAGWRTVNPATGRYSSKSGQRIIPGRSEYHDPSF